jgi:hypothetical protein
MKQNNEKSTLTGEECAEPPRVKTPTTFINAETRSDRLMAVNAHAIHNTKKRKPRTKQKKNNQQ